MTIPEDLIAQAVRYYDSNSTWGILHAVLEDYNTDDHDLDHAAEYGQQVGDTEGLALVEALRPLHPCDRHRLSILAEGGTPDESLLRSMYADEYDGGSEASWSPETVDAMWHLAGLVWDFYQLDSCSVGGPLHVVLDDNNIEEVHIRWCAENLDDWCAKWASRPTEIPAIKAQAPAIIDGLLALTEHQRLQVTGHWANQYGSQRPVRPATPDVPQPPVEIPKPPPLPERPAADDSEFVHDSVFLRAPSGTDPLAAMREVLGVFMERRDGTNAMEWWQRVRWWHGGQAGLKRGDELLPPSETGRLPALEGTDPTSVYITSNRAEAVFYCLRHDRPMLYEVTVREEPDVDDVLPEQGSSRRVRRAKVYRLEQPSRHELMEALRQVTRPAD